MKWVSFFSLFASFYRFIAIDKIFDAKARALRIRQVATSRTISIEIRETQSMKKEKLVATVVENWLINCKFIHIVYNLFDYF